MKQRSFSLVGLVLVLALSGAAVVQAQARAPRPSARSLVTAKSHFKQGRAYQEAGAYADAIKEYEKAFLLVPLPEMLYNIGQCQRLAGEKHKAIAAYQRYLDRVSDGDLADEARAHVAALKLKIQVEESELAKRKALEEAEAARRKAREMDDARRKAEEEATRRLQEQKDDQDRLRRMAQEEARRMKEKMGFVVKEYERSLALAKKQGYALRATGITAMVLGSVALAAAALTGFLFAEKYDHLRDWDLERRWIEQGNSDPTWKWGNLTEDVRWMRLAHAGTWGFGIGGGTLLAAGIVLYRYGVNRRNRAIGALEQPVTLLPEVTPGSYGLLLGGRF